VIRILVTGSNGQLGSELRVLANSNTQSKEWIFTDRSELDFLNLQSVVDRLDFYKPDVVINCAAFTAVDKAESEYELADLVNHKAVEIIANWTSSNNILSLLSD